VDIVGVLNDLTGNDLLFWKVVVATVAFLLVGVEVLFAARFWGVTTFPPLNAGLAARVHRINGRIALTLAVVVAFSCLVGPAGPTSPTRVLLHSIFGTLLFVLLTAKFTLLRVLRTGDRLLPYVGTLVFLAFAAIWATSVADYVAAS
jgi:hypothetical protein